MSEKTLYPLTAQQSVIEMAYKYALKKSVVNICAAVDFYSEIDIDMLLKAIKISLKRNRSANYRLTLKDKKLHHYLEENVEPEGIEIIDLSDKTDEQREAVYEKWGRKKFANKSQNAQLYRIKVIKKNDGYYGLFLCVSHFVFDAYAIICMINDIFVVYRAMQKGEEPAPCELDPIEAYKADYKYMESTRLDKDRKYWQCEILGTEPQFTCIGGTDAKEYIVGSRQGVFLHLLKSKGKMINLDVPSDIVTDVNEYALNNGISPQSVYFLGLRNYLSMVCDKTDDVTFGNNCARRGTKAQKNGGGCLVNAMYVRTIMSPDIVTFAEGCKIMNQTCQKNYLHCNVPHSETMDYLAKQYGKKPLNDYYTCSTTYQYETGIDSGGIKYSFHRVGNGSNSMPVYITMMPKDNFSGKYLFNYEYVVGVTNPKDIHKLHDYILGFIKNGIKNPDLTLAELMI